MAAPSGFDWPYPDTFLCTECDRLFNDDRHARCKKCIQSTCKGCLYGDRIKYDSKDGYCRTCYVKLHRQWFYDYSPTEEEYHALTSIFKNYIDQKESGFMIDAFYRYNRHDDVKTAISSSLLHFEYTLDIYFEEEYKFKTSTIGMCCLHTDSFDSSELFSVPKTSIKRFNSYIYDKDIAALVKYILENALGGLSDTISKKILLYLYFEKVTWVTKYVEQSGEFLF